jgi:hypothetical protein
VPALLDQVAAILDEHHADGGGNGA